MSSTQTGKKKDRRSYPRVALESLVRIRCPGGDSFSAPIRDISRSGISAICNQELHDKIVSRVDAESPEKALFRLSFSLPANGPGNRVDASCSLAHLSSRDKYFLAGFKFHSFEKQGYEVVESFILESMRY